MGLIRVMRAILFLMAFLGLALGEEGKIRAGQTLLIQVTGVADSEKGRLNNAYGVSQDGHITMWKIGKVQAAGKTKSALGREIAGAYQKAGIYENPVFQILLDHDPHPIVPRVTVGGQVRRAGQIKWEEGMTLGDLLGAAGGVTPFAEESLIRLYRLGKIYKLDNEEGKARKIRIYPMDAIEVTQEAIRVR